jgi:hypothetical protein
VIHSALYREPQLLDSNLHRHKKLKGVSDMSMTKNMHAVFLTATEFPQAALDFPIIFINTGEKLANGKALISPVALLGLTANENLRLDGGRWDARYVPAFIRRFPFLTARVQGAEAPGVFVDAAFSGFNDTEGEPLFDADGKPTEALKGIITFLQRFDEEQQRTRIFCERLAGLDILKEMQADATMPNGETVKVEGFMIIDEEKLNALPDATVVELHRSGMLMLMQVHLISMSNMRDLMQRKAARLAAEGASPATATA